MISNQWSLIIAPWEGEAPAEPNTIITFPLSLFANPRSLGIPDARDKSRSLGFSPGTNFSSPLKSQLFFMDGAEQECSGYILCSASFSASPTKLQPAAAHMIVR